MADLVRAILDGYGPFGLDELTRWTALDRPVLRAAVAPLGDELVELDTEGHRGWITASRADAVRAAEPSRVVRLLPGFDPYVIGALRQLDRLVPAPEHKAAVSRTSGWISPVLLDGGRIAGTWTQESTGGRLAIEITPFGPLRRGVRAAAEAEAARWAAYAAAPSTSPGAPRPPAWPCPPRGRRATAAAAARAPDARPAASSGADAVARASVAGGTRQQRPGPASAGQSEAPPAGAGGASGTGVGLVGVLGAAGELAGVLVGLDRLGADVGCLARVRHLPEEADRLLARVGDPVHPLGHRRARRSCSSPWPCSSTGPSGWCTSMNSPVGSRLMMPVSMPCSSTSRSCRCRPRQMPVGQPT